MKHSIPHELDIDLARKATDRAIAEYSQRFAKYNPQFNWVDDRHGKLAFTAKGLTLTGEVELKEGAIDVDLDVPFMLKPFRKKALDVVEGQVREWVERAKNGELE